MVGPCSIHDPAAGLDYAKRLRKPAAEFQEDGQLALECLVEEIDERQVACIDQSGIVADLRPP